MFKKSISIILVIVLVWGFLTVLPLNATAQDADIAGEGIDLGLAETGAYNYLFPVNNGGAIAYYYGNTASYGGWHDGIDIHSNGDDTIYAACDGVVEATANSCNCGYGTTKKCDHYNTYGNYIRIKNSDGTKSYYGHLLINTLLVSSGDSVKRGQPIATMGSSGWSSGKHLHFEMRLSDGNTKINTNPVSSGGEMNYSYSGYGEIIDYIDLGDHFYAAIIHKESGKALTEDNENINLQNRDGRNKQRWEFRRQSDGSYKIVNFHTGELMEVEHSGTDIGDNVGTWWSNDGDCQRWFIVSESGGYAFIPKNAQDRALDLSYTGNIQIWSQNFSSDQIFDLDYQPSFTPDNMGADFYANIVHVASGKTVNQKNDDVVLGDRDYSDNTVWHFVRQSDTCYKIINLDNDKCLDVSGGSSDNHTNIQTWDSLNNYPQRWFLTERNGGYALVPKCALSSAMDLSYTGNIQVYEQTFNNDQIFRIEKLPILPQNIGEHFYASIIHKESGKALTEDNENVNLQNRDGRNKQRWEFKRQTDGSYEIINFHTGELLEVEHGSTDVGGNVGTWWSNGGDCQYWYIQSKNNGFAFVPKNAPYRALDLSYTGNIQIWSQSYNSDQIFDLDYQPSFTPDDIGTDFYANIVHLTSGKTVLQNDGNVELGAKDNSKNTIWYFIRQSDNSYKIVNLDDNKCLDVSKGLSDNQTNIQTWNSLDNYQQRWFITERNGGYALVPKCALSSAMDLSYTGNIQVYEQTFNSDQIFTIDKLESLPTEPTTTPTEPTNPPTEPPTNPPTEPSVIKLGDVDGDDEVTIIDATCIQRKLVSIATAKFVEAAADTDEDGELTIIDATVIQRWLAQLPTNENIGKPSIT